MKERNEKFMLKNNKGILCYLVNFAIMAALYILSSIIYCIKSEGKEDNILFCLVIMVSFIVSYWLVYFLYKTILKNARALKIVLILANVFGLFFLISWINYSLHYLLIVVCLISIISETVINLVMSKKN